MGKSNPMKGGGDYQNEGEIGGEYGKDDVTTPHLILYKWITGFATGLDSWHGSYVRGWT